MKLPYVVVSSAAMIILPRPYREDPLATRMLLNTVFC